MRVFGWFRGNGAALAKYQSYFRSNAIAMTICVNASRAALRSPGGMVVRTSFTNTFCLTDRSSKACRNDWVTFWLKRRL
jgi:hypothetical protein